ncbi:MAG TPA: multiheme c-type cytochrome [Gemmatimonadaceae bacterium]|nr:multiheme c-type cytochrome [Gemmatimonadaceae bacterium]
MSSVARHGGVVATLALSLSAGCDRSPTADAARFVGSTACRACHAAEYNAWEPSQHALAMRAASPDAVLGDFNNARVSAGGVTTTFIHDSAGYVVNTASGAGRTHDFPVRFTFGVWPLQQYLVAYTGGRLQALTLAWDARPAQAGGQRWFSLEPEQVAEHAAAGADAPHWMGRGYNWNYMCADCHAVGVRKGYRVATSTYNTTYSEIGVGCEGCHGPGSSHVEWGGRSKPVRSLFYSNDGLVAQLTERRGVRWTVASGGRIASRSAPRRTDREIETCAQCHSRRVHIADGYVAGKPLYDYYIPALLTSDLYHADGQQREEVYTYGSFLQSRMYAAGVTCSDCHDPHTGKTRRAGNQVCTQCHVASAYDTSAHTFHRATSSGSACVSCHMPDTTYMQIDARHDHSMRIPRPDLSVTLGVPNACTRCHSDRSAEWAARAVATWYPRPTGGHQRFAFAFAADDAGDARGPDSLLRVARDSTESAIARGSALARLAGYSDTTAYRVAGVASADPNPLVRLGALQLLESAPADFRIKPAALLLHDERRALRQGAAWVLASLASSLPANDRAAFARAAAEFVESQRYNADQPEDRLALGAFYAQQGRYDSAATEYRAALRLEPNYPRAVVFLAAVMRAQGRLPDALAVLDSARTRMPRDADIQRSIDVYRREAAALSGAQRARP